MSTPVFNSRRAERFAQLLDGVNGGRAPQSHASPSHAPHSNADSELHSLAAIGHRLSSIEFDLHTEPEFQTGLRAMLMATIERDGIGATAVNPESTPDASGARNGTTHPVLVGRKHRRPTAALPVWYAPVRSRRARGAILIGLAAGTLAVSGMSVASGDAIPGDTLYGIKRSTEKAQLALAGSEVGRGQLYLEFAKTRTNEAVAVLDDPNGLSDVLSDLDAETRQGVRLLTTAAVDRHDAAPLDIVDAFVATQRHTLVEMQSGLSGPARNRVGISIALLDDIKRRSSDLRATLTCDDLGRELDQLGPLPGHCAAQQPAVKSNAGTPTPTGTTTVRVVPTPAASSSPSPVQSTSAPTEPIEDVLPSVLPS